MTDVVNHPSHYAEGWSNGAEVIDITENLNFNRGNAVKYIARAGKKDLAKEIEDLEKARWYIERELYRLGQGDRDPILDAKIAEDDDFFIEHMDQPVQPRVWESLSDVPKTVKVVDKDGDLWDLSEEVYYFQGKVLEIHHNLDYDCNAPFTEVVE